MPAILQSGDASSRFKPGGSGEIHQIRKYTPGDEVRLIDRNVSARMGEYYVRVYRDDLGMDLLFLQDISSSMDFGIRSKKDIAVDVIAALMVSAQNKIEKFHLVPFSDRVENKISQSNSNTAPIAILTHALSFPSRQAVTNLEKAISYVYQTQKQKALICILSDFVFLNFPTNYLVALSKKHLLFAIHILDPLEFALPEAGWIRLQDPESRRQLLWNFGDPIKRKQIESFIQKKILAIKNNFHKIGAQYLQLGTSQDYLQKLWIYLSASRRSI